MKIAVLGTRGFPHIQGGIEAHCQNLYPLLVSKGCEVIVFSRKPYARLPRDTFKGVRLISLPCFKNKFLEAFSHSFLGVIAARGVKPDILHVHGIGPALIVPLARFLGLKVVMTHHGSDYERKKWNAIAKFFLKLGERSGMRWAQGIICVSETIAGHLKRTYGRKISVIPNGVAVPKTVPAENTLKKYGLTRGKYILAVGRFVPEKGFHDLITAFNRLGDTGWKLAIVGRADHKDAYTHALESEAKKNKNIILTGFLSGCPLQEIYSHAGLFVLPSYYEGLPIVLLEGLSFGLPVLASDIPQNREIVADETRLFNAGNIAQLSGMISALMARGITKEEKAREINRIQGHYNWDVIADKTFAVYRALRAA